MIAHLEALACFFSLRGFFIFLEIETVFENGTKITKRPANEISELNLGPFDEIGSFAIHPGGRKILEVCDEVFSLTSAQSQPAYEVLKNFGNMSSTTVIFVLDELSKKLKAKKSEEQILSFAFGPGLTFESMVLTYA